MDDSDRLNEANENLKNAFIKFDTEFTKLKENVQPDDLELDGSKKAVLDTSKQREVNKIMELVNLAYNIVENKDLMTERYLKRVNKLTGGPNKINKEYLSWINKTEILDKLPSLNADVNKELNGIIFINKGLFLNTEQFGYLQDENNDIINKYFDNLIHLLLNEYVYFETTNEAENYIDKIVYSDIQKTAEQEIKDKNNTEENVKIVKEIIQKKINQHIPEPFLNPNIDSLLPETFINKLDEKIDVVARSILKNMELPSEN